MRTIHLEILRQGPPHNQLLSPLTEYLALCENHPAVPVRLPFEHADFMLRLYALRYRKDPEYRSLEVEEVSRWMTWILAQVPGLIREMADQSGVDQPGGDQSAGAKDLIHLRLTLSANELALLPFEMASASWVFGSAGEPMLLQSQTPVCITREGRRVPAKRLEWPPPPNPKILFAAAGPSAPIPLKEHLLVLRRAIDPWVSHYNPEDETERRLRIDEHLKVLPQATLRQIEEECASANYTHVHILSHGVPVNKGDDRRYGLALHDRMDPAKPDIVDGVRLAKALRPPRQDGKSGFARPAIVTLAACDAGGVGGVVWSGASIAHALHEEGIPLVVASQFPLSFAASVIMTKVLYGGFLSGEDPRTLLVNLRRELLTQSPSTHDWASVVAYASFPQAFDRQLSRTRTEQAFRRFEAAINHIDKNLRPSNENTDLTEDQRRVQEARKRIDLLLENEQEPKIYGILASAEKRMAEIWWRLGKNKKLDELLDVRDTLMSARRFYEEAFKRDRSQVWALVQALVLTAVIRSWNTNEELSLARWELARRFSEEELDFGHRDRWSWASANLMELYVLAPLIPNAGTAGEDSPEKAEYYALKFKSVTEFSSINVHSTRRQMERYSRFFAEINPEMEPVAGVADRMLKILPQSSKFS
jgi:hypothetical protein